MGFVTGTLAFMMWLIVLCIFVPIAITVLLITIVAVVHRFNYVEIGITTYFQNLSKRSATKNE